MKIISTILVALCLSMPGLKAQTASSSLPTVNRTGQTAPAGTPYVVVDRGANDRVWQRTTYETTPDGQQVPHLHQYTELATGLHYRKNGQWVESKEQIDILPDGTAAAIQGQHQAYFPGDIYQGVIEVVTPDGIHLRSRPIGLSYDDGNNTVLIAELKDSVGQLTGSNQVIYPDAFTDFKADLRYTYTKTGFEQDIVLHEQPPSPKTYGLNAQTARLQVLTEFFDTPGPKKTPPVANRHNGLDDTALEFGTMKMTRGKAFLVGDQAQTHARAKGTPVAKSWQHLSGRTFLVEELPVSKIKPQLEKLPLPVDAGTTLNSPDSLRHKVSATRLLPPVRLVQAGTNTVQLAKADLSQRPGVVLDYIQINSDQTDFTFQSGTTYFVAGEMNFSGTTTFKGGSVIKVAVGYDSAVDIDENGTIVCPTNPAQPAVFTSMNDDSVGETIDGSSGGPFYSDVGGFLTLNCPDPVIRNMCFKYGYHCVLDWYFYGGGNRNLNIWDCQFINVVIAVEVENCNVGLHNVLITEVGDDKPIYIDDSGDLVAENVTVDGYHNLGGGNDGNFKTNCLFSESWWNGSYYDYYVSVNGNGYTVSQTQTFFLPPDSYYLAPNSPYRDFGTTNINPDLLAELRQTTTYPPYDGNWPDTNAPDLGYHYPVAAEYHGLPDDTWWLIQYFGHWQGVIAAADPDGDGFSTGYEYFHGATDPTTFDFARLAYWSFDNTNTWAGDNGQLLVASNIVGAVTWHTNGMRINSPNPAILTYQDITGGKANIILHDGTVRFWFKPDWSSANIGGTGPGGYGRMIELGHYSPTPTDGWWALYFSPDGNHLMFASATNGIIMTNLTTAISLVSNQWYLVNFAYTPYLTTIVINSHTNHGTGITCFPNATVRAQGLHVGSDASGLNQARGTFEDLETFNYYSLTMDCLPPIAPPQYIPPWLGLVGWWRAESNVVDSANFHYGLAEHITYVSGQVGTAFHFDPTINVPRVKIPDRPDFQLTNALSISAWVRPRGDGYVILYRGDGHRGLDPYVLSMQGNNTVQFSIQDEATNVAPLSTVIAYNQWSHLTATFDGDSGTMKLYVNGTFVNQTNTTIKPLQVLNPSLDPAIGIGNTGEDKNNFPFIGDIDEVMLYARALSSDEISAIYSAGASQIPRCGWTTNGPPHLSHVNLLKLPAINGTYAIPYSALLTNSDAYDPQGYPLVFKVDSVVTGSLMVNGAPFGPDNCTINPAAAVVWTPPAMLVAPGTPAFRVYVFDGIYRSANTVDVVIKQHPKTHLFGWGYNTFGEVGNGFLSDPAADPAESTFDPLVWQSAQSLIPRDPRWQYYPTNFINMSTNGYEYTPKQILDADNIISVSADESGVWRITCGISADGKLYQWGEDGYFLFGKCLASNTTNYSTLGSTTFWEWGSGPPSEFLYPVGLRVPSPKLYQMPFPNGDYQPFNNIKTVVNGGLFEIALKNDGTLWSWGQASWVNLSLNNAFGRHPQDDSFSGEPGTYGMSPRRIEFEGNNNSGVIDGRQVVEIKVDNYARDLFPTAIARCQDGTFWWWGIMGEWYADGWQLWDVDITGEEASHPMFDSAVPTRLTNFDSPAGVPDTSIIQMDIKGNHLVVLKQDGSVWELGYIPHLDNGGADLEDIMNSYSHVPLQVTGLPQNVVSICSGIRFGVAVTSDGNVWIWGFAPDASANDTAPRQIRSFKNITKVVSTGYVWWTDASWQQLLALDKNGSVWGWWHDLNDYINFNNTIQTNAFRIPGLENVTDIFCGVGNNFAIGTEEQGKPTNLKAKSLNQGVQLSWTNYPGATYYIVYRSLNEENGYAAIGTATVDSYLDQNPPLQNGVTYYYEVSAVINGVETAPSWWAAATPQPVPSPVVNLVAVNECRAVKLLWSAPANAALSNPQEYRIERLSPFDVAFVPVAHCQQGATSYEDDLVVAGQTCYYRVIPINSAGSPATNVCAIVHGTLDAGSCAPSPTISANWWQGQWFEISAPAPSEFGFNSTATLCWAGPQTGSWGAGLTGFRIHWRIEYQYNNKTYTFGPFTQDVSLTDVAATVQRTMPNGNSVTCYQYSWHSFGDYGTRWWASVSAIVNGQESLPSIEAGPRSATTGVLDWNVTPRAVPGYQQVYLDWQDDDAICQYAVECSTLPPSIGFVLGDWVTLADGLTEPRYWDVGFAATNFAPVDIKYLFREDRPPNLISRLTADPESKDPVSTIVWGLLSSSATNALANANVNDATNIRQLLASELNRIIHSGSVIFTTNEVGMTDADLSTRTKNLLGRLNNANPPLSSDELVHLNRLLLEDAYVHEIARIDEPAPAEFVSGDIHNYLVTHLLSMSGPIAAIVTNYLSQADRDSLAGYSGVDLPIQRLLAVKLTRIIQTNVVLFTTNDVYNESLRDISARTRELYARRAELNTNEISLLNRLLLEDAWFSLEPLSTLRYYWVRAVSCGGSEAYSAWVAARPSDQATNPPSLSFSAQAFPYSSMALVQWNFPGTTDQTSGLDTTWQFSVERKEGTSGTYGTISQTGFGLTYLDPDVVNDHSYRYRVTAFDPLYNRYQAETALVTPTNSAGLTLFAPAPGNGYVDLTWTPIRANQFNVKHSLNPNGPYEIVASINTQNAFHNARNAYRHLNVQNGVTHYYQIQAFTPVGSEIDSDIKSATPLATLAPLPPGNFHGQFVPDSTNGLAVLSWNSRSGAQTYQVFLCDQSRLTPLAGYNGVNTTCIYKIPEGTVANTVFTFAVRSVNAQGLAGDLAETTVTNLPPPITAPTVPATVVLQVAGSRNTPLNVTGPTNLTLNAEVNIPGVQQVSFYCDGQLIGTATGAPFQITWFHVPGGNNHVVTAVALVQGQDASSFVSLYYGGGTATFSSSDFIVNVSVEPELAAYQTSAIDLQLPAPTLPITLSRSYSSRNTDTNGPLGVGWMAGWAVGSVRLSNPLSDGWLGVTQTGFASQQYCYISDNVGHCVTVTLPDGESISFAPQLQYDTTTFGGGYPSIEVNPAINISFQPFAPNSGVFSASLGSPELSGSIDVDADHWNGTPIGLESVGLSQISYISPDGASYLFDQPGNDSLTWLLTRITDRNGNSLIYTYNPDKTLQSISNSCGRIVRFSYSVPQNGTTNISVFDSLQPQGNPAIVYVTVNSQLTEVRRLVDRSGAGTYETTRYAYGTAGADLNRLTDITDARGIRVLHNVYTNANGDVMVQISPGRTNTFQFNSSNYDLTVTATSSTATNTVLMTSDASGAISGATQPVSGSTPANALATRCTYDDRGRLIAQTDANGHTKTYTYDDLDRLVGQSDENGNGTSVALNSFGQPNISTDARGKQTLYEYDNQGNPLNVRDPSGTATDYFYSTPVSAGGQVQLGKMLVSQKQNVPFVPYTLVTEYSYNTNSPIKGDLTSMSQKWVMDTNTIGNAVTTSYQYDANGNRTVEIKTRTVNGGTQTIHTEYYYDAQNRVTNTVVWADGTESLARQTNTVTYNKLGKPYITTDVAGRSTTCIYDFNGNLIETVYPDGMVSRTSYDGFGRQQYVQERAKRITYNGSTQTTVPATRNTYDASGRVIKVEKFDNVTLTESQATAGTDFVGAPTETQYKMVAADPASSAATTTRTFYDAVGRVQYSVSARGAVTEYRYDDAGRRTSVLVYAGYTFDPAQTGTNAPNPSGPSQSTSYTYDANGNQLTVTDAAGNTTTSIYDDANRVVEVRYPASNGTVSRFTYYDGLGRKLQENDEAGVATAYSYDFRGLLTSVTLAAGTTQAVTTVYQYDELGNLTKQTDAAGHSTTFRYDALGRRTGRTLPLNESEGFAYDIVGNVLYQTNFNGVVITNQYDVMNRLTNCSSVNGFTVSYIYNSWNSRATMADASGVTSYSYDNLRRLQAKTVAWTNGPTASLNYLYDNTGSLTNLWSSTSNGVNLVYSYDLLGRLTNVLANGNAAAGYGFDLVGNLQATRYGNGVSNLYQYDSRNRLTSLVWKTNETAIASFAYQLGLTGNRTSLNETIIGTSRQYAWTYDLLYRLKQEVISGGTSGVLLYGYDAVGNRTNRQSNISQLTNCSPSFNANDWLTSDNYDNNGNTTSSSGNSYQYDALNHLTNVNNGAILMTYDGDGNRASKKVGATTTFYLVDDRNPSGYAQVLEDQNVTSTTTNLAFVYNYGLSLINQRRVGNGVVRYYGLDGHGSTRFLIDGPTATVSDTLTYDAYGNLIASTGISARKYLFCCEQWDQDLGMYYLRARYYAPGTGRFWTMDTYAGNNEDPLSLHKYLYCHGNPVMRIDPSGQDGDLVSLGVAGSIGTALDANYNGGTIAAGNALQQTIFGVQAGKTAESIAADYVFDTIKDFATGYLIHGVAGMIENGGSFRFQFSGGRIGGALYSAIKRVGNIFNPAGGNSACVPAVAATLKTMKEDNGYNASQIEMKYGACNSTENPVGSVGAAKEYIEKAVENGVSLEAVQGTWRSANNDGVYVIGFGRYNGGPDRGGHVVIGVIEGGKKCIYEPSTGGQPNYAQLREWYGDETQTYKVNGLME